MLLFVPCLIFVTIYHKFITWRCWGSASYAVSDVLCKQELESNLAAKEASLPLEPPSDKEGVITLVVRMPDGSRQGRRFLKSDKFKVSCF